MYYMMATGLWYSLWDNPSNTVSFDEANEDIISLFRQLSVIGGLWMNKVYHSENKIYNECSCNEFILIKKELVIIDYLLQKND